MTAASSPPPTVCHHQRLSSCQTRSIFALSNQASRCKEGVWQTCLINIYGTFMRHSHQHPHTHTLWAAMGSLPEGLALNLVKLWECAKIIQVQNRAIILAQLNGESAHCRFKKVGGGRPSATSTCIINNSSWPFVGVSQKGRCRAAINLMAQHVSPLEQQVTFQFNLSYLPPCPPHCPLGVSLWA